MFNDSLVFKNGIIYLEVNKNIKTKKTKKNLDHTLGVSSIAINNLDKCQLRSVQPDVSVKSWQFFQNLTTSIFTWANFARKCIGNIFKKAPFGPPG